MRRGDTLSASVLDCDKGENGRVFVKYTASGEAQVVAACEPKICMYTSNSAITWFGTTWRVWLAPDNVLLNKEVSTQDKDATLQKYVSSNVCKKIQFEENGSVPNL